MNKEDEGKNNIKKNTLKNKFAYYICNNKKSKGKVKLALIVKAGSLMEQGLPNGTAHFTEHLCIDSNVAYLKNVGKYYEDNNILQGYTNFEQTVYYFDCTIDNIDEGFSVFKNILSDCFIDRRLMEKVKKDLIVEIDYRMKCANFGLQNNILPVIIGDKNIKDKFPLGKIKCIEKMEFQSVKSFHDKWYKPQNSAICICGDIANSDIENKISKYFSEFKNDNEKIEKYSTNYCPYGEKVVVNNNVNKNEVKAQFYYLKKDYKYSLKSDTIEYFLFSIIKNYILDLFTDKSFGIVEFYSKVFLHNLKLNVLEFKSQSEFVERLEFIIDSINKIQAKGINENDFVKYKRIFYKDLKSYHKEYKYYQSEEIIKECINNFLYDEELMTLSNEYEACNLIVDNIKFKEFNKIISQELNNKNLILVVNGQEKFNLEYMNKFSRFLS
ncbi:zinc protease [Clostridium acetobutylicum]|uniref:Predicted Zn-dependent peptidase n=1 Tax=Clostridium acetobutylicum (strain ATCC 824 / DSM 792 / JCM 1419 / IAM 19013 / LMG 5710 / NBRC 13948 / NRRL B-527 / VKM B-1787 / 2291 / W) TaxID=272562 RepID=Q97LA3_CLOAB|nr:MULTISPECIES: pitrilysin family protein [Clostridium]AAK78636.1 Predicted Zn-dependent peptidase [Clostridium acetobutylicum ATCC 824]ADZ19710.1 Zn-dependent peptidase [Clostridium acetobutylicum EA 2018]AEI34120.1 Zn-dependent peptidase [Clostridium acetobutylicum DSM 1731]AWV80357.1 insulinase family protein [Clostridium acetobutylicum]MBC2392545.1 insulinase family protein [Clostridium acetobutylicum]